MSVPKAHLADYPGFGVPIPVPSWREAKVAGHMVIEAFESTEVKARRADCPQPAYRRYRPHAGVN
jgi:hypothetical protein